MGEIMRLKHRNGSNGLLMLYNCSYTSYRIEKALEGRLWSRPDLDLCMGLIGEPYALCGLNLGKGAP